MCDRYSCIFYLIPIKKLTKISLRPFNTIFLTLISPKQNGVSVKLSNIITSLQRRNEHNVFANRNVDVMISPGFNTCCVLPDKQIRAHFKYFQSKVSKGAKIRNRYNQLPHLTQDTHFQTARESHDLNMVFVHLTTASNKFA